MKENSKRVWFEIHLKRFCKRLFRLDIILKIQLTFLFLFTSLFVLRYFSVTILLYKTFLKKVIASIWRYISFFFILSCPPSGFRAIQLIIHSLLIGGCLFSHTICLSGLTCQQVFFKGFFFPFSVSLLPSLFLAYYFRCLSILTDIWSQGSVTI